MFLWKWTFKMVIFSAPEPKAQVHYFDHALSVDRWSVVNFSYFRLLFWNCWTKFNKIWQEARSQRPLPSLCFSRRLERQDGHPGLWLAETFSTSPQKSLNGIQWNLTGSTISTSSTKLCYLGWSEKQDGRPNLWLAVIFSTSSLKLLNGIQQNLTGSTISTSSTKFVFFAPIVKTRWPPWPLIVWDIFDFFSETAEQNSTKLNRQKDLNVFYQVCVFWADRKTQDCCPGIWLAKTFSTSPQKPLNRIQRNLTGSKISTSSTKIVFFRADQ